VKSLQVALCSVLLGAVTVCHAAQHAGAMVCTGSAGNLSFNVSFFDIGVSNSLSTGSESGGAGAGKVTFQPLVIHTALSTFTSLWQVAAEGSHFTTCTLKTQDSSGGNIEFTLNLVAVQSVNAIASSAGGDFPRYAFVKADLEFGSIQVRTSGAVDDGGAGPGGGWNRIHNN
jgi:hypothetical protein